MERSHDLDGAAIVHARGISDLRQHFDEVCMYCAPHMNASRVDCASSRSDFTKRNLATESQEFNCKNKIFNDLFPELVEQVSVSVLSIFTSLGTDNLNLDIFSQYNSRSPQPVRPVSSSAVVVETPGELQLSWTVICAIIAVILSSSWALVSFSLG